MDRIAALRAHLLAAVGRVQWLAPLLARLAVGLVFLSTGWGKVHHLDKVTSFFEQLGIPAPGFNAVLVGCSELICGTLLVVGLVTRLAAMPLVISMVVAILTARLADIHGLFDHRPGRCVARSLAGPKARLVERGAARVSHLVVAT